MDIRGFRLTQAPDAFIDDPYPYYAALREHSPVHEMEPGSIEGLQLVAPEIEL